MLIEEIMKKEGETSMPMSVRQNHALEHATIVILSRKVSIGTRMMGRSTWSGFYIYGDLPTELIAEAAREALARLQKGEAELAISPFCGTNLVVTGLLAGVFSFIVMGKENQIRRLPRVIFAGVIAAIVAQPAGRMAQRYVTTSANLANVSITRITKRGRRARTLHKVETAHRWD